jgi:putative (di)nucleoside polyphosphate hydrolase
MGKHQSFRANVGIAVLDGEGRVLALQRRGKKGAWQMPQGGLDAGEQPYDAALRELNEETGLSAQQVQLVAEHPRWLAYELPEQARSKKTGRGQVQKWFLLRLLDDAGSFDPTQIDNDEFTGGRWMTLPRLAEIVWLPKRPIYEDLVGAFSEYLAS